MSTFSATVSKLGSQYTTKVRWTANSAGSGGGYLEIYCVGSSAASIGMSIKGLHTSSGLEIGSTPYGFNMTGLTYTSSELTL